MKQGGMHDDCDNRGGACAACRNGCPSKGTATAAPIGAAGGTPGMTTKRLDGRTRRVEAADLVPGTVLRMVQADGGEEVPAPFSDAVVIGPGSGPAELRLWRPYVVGGELGKESFSVPVDRLVDGSLFRTVLTASGDPYRV